MSEGEFIKYEPFKMGTGDYIPPTPEELAEDKRCTLYDNISILRDMLKTEEPETLSEVTDTKSKGSLGLQNIHHDTDPKQAILDLVGTEILSKINLYGAQVLVATYVRPEKLRSGLIITSKVRDEDKFQGKCGLVIKTGPLAFVETEKLKFGGCKVSVGDWAWYRPMDGFALSLAGVSDAVHCRVLDDVEIRGDLEHPDVIL